MHLASIVIHCRDPYTMGPFWSAATGIPIYPEDRPKVEQRTLDPDESVYLEDRDRGIGVWISPSPDPRPVGRIHLDLNGDYADVERLVALGASRVRETDESVVLADPEGNEFCLVFR